MGDTRSLGTVKASCAAGPISPTESGATKGGISPDFTVATITDTYWNTNLTDIADDFDTNTPEGKTAQRVAVRWEPLRHLRQLECQRRRTDRHRWSVEFRNAHAAPILKFDGVSLPMQGSLSTGMARSNRNNPVVGDTAGVCFWWTGPPCAPSPQWRWQRSTDGKTWTNISPDGGLSHKHARRGGF